MQTYLYSLVWRLKNRDRSGHYRDFYKEIMRIRTATDPRAAVGGMWDDVGRMQFDFMCQQGLQPSHTLLDFGCGCLRGGLHFIRFLNKGNYWGVDISPEILDKGKELLAEAGLNEKTPTLRVNRDLKFDDFGGKKFDFILAVSVLTHMPLEDTAECFENIRKVMKPTAVFFATFLDGGNRTYTKRGYQDFYHPFETMKKLGESYHLQVSLVETFAHPRKQKMMRITRGHD
jgi:cyclopropane fatty-acyl-phospholipid synthase-like methyltransferase